MQKSILIFLAVFLSASAYADNDLAAFNSAWQAYATATESDDGELVVETAAHVVDAGKPIFTDDDGVAVAVASVKTRISFSLE